jgi:NADH-quinone oxidoreductase subunit J
MIDVALGLLILISVSGAVLAVSLKKVFHNLLGFAASVVGMAGVVLVLGSEFVALVLMLIFLGGISIAMVFAIMMSTPREQSEERHAAGRLLPALGVGLGFSGALGFAMARTRFPEGSAKVDEAWTTAELGRQLMTRFELPFEAISLLLLLAILGAVVIARRTREGVEEARG